ncbi:hypothetical protein [Hymenobacter volaticus]|uniref:Delta-60 repeat domain-containing protein n=1 Tax=Hymenobacter volaticus TaxID=2932254 RepID=A0ABY4G2P0_9BACT|nr:hypothetical protein [Hymenobacter volaticus]UOQ65051.1 hypothetical protein MUN86_15950 [Hymenobacter volaticus]
MQPDGKILALFGGGIVPPSQIIRLTTNGGIDPTWNAAAAYTTGGTLVSLQLLAGGQVLFGGGPQQVGPPSALPVGVGQLTSTGALDSSFPVPTLQAPGMVSSLAQQSDGKILVAGTFTEINGNTARGIARLNMDGSVDAAYTTACQITQGYPTKVLLQADEKVLVAGRFARIGGIAAPSLARVQTNGIPDPGFVPALAITPTTDFNYVNDIALESDGNILVGGNLRLGSNTSRTFLRLFPGGALDNSFQPPANLSPAALLVQSDNKIVLLNNDRVAASVQRLLPSGSLDPSFATIPPHQIIKFLASEA